MGNESAYLKRLKERIRQNPDSKLFLSLAEELRKEGRTEEATAMLADGIGRNPEFASARLTLGRWYLSANLFEEAKKEFSELVGKFPGNAFAHRGLAEAYRSLGLEKNAVEEYRKVLAINPFDEESISYLEAAGCSTETTEAPAAEAPHAEETPAEIPESGVQESEEVPQAWSEEVSVAAVQESESTPENAEAPMREDARVFPDVAAPAAPDLSEVETLIAAGQYAKALNVLDTMLSSGMTDLKIRQQKEELISLIKLLRNDKEFVIARLSKLSLLITEGFAARRERKRQAAVNRLAVLLDSVKVRFARKYTDSLPEGS
ncbi:MAG TPA: tetratricopeptide repeat protein [Dissulfurispiraceae bacterium]